MPDITIDQIVQDIKGGMTVQDKTPAFNKVYQDIAALQQQDGAGSAKYRDDLNALNNKLHEQNILPGLEIRGVEEGKAPVPGNSFSFGKSNMILLSDGMPKHEPKPTDILAVKDWYPGLVGTLSPTQQNLLTASIKATQEDPKSDPKARQLWSVKHPSPGLADSPDPPGPPYYGGPGGYGCAPSVSEALRRAGIFRPDEDGLCVQDVQTLLQDSHGWKPVFDSRNDPANGLDIRTQALEPGDVILGYRKGDSHSGPGAHVAIVGEDGKIYHHGLAPDPNNPGHKHEEWTQGNLGGFYKQEFTDGIVVLRAPDA